MTRVRFEADEDKQTTRRLLTVLLIALALGSVFLVVTLALSSCAAKIETTLRPDGGARLSLSLEVPSALAGKLRKLTQKNSAAPLFDAAAIKKSLASRPSLSLVDLAVPSPETLQAVVSARSIEELAADPDVRAAGLLTITKGPGWTEMKVRLARGGARAMAVLFPGIDPYLLDALSPPALEEEPVTKAEYRDMLKSVLGDKAMPSMEAAAVVVTIVAPGTVLAAGGGTLEGNKLSLTVPVIDALVLENPIEFWIRWKT